MAFDEKLAARLRTLLATRQDVQEKQMFGGVAFLVRGSMCVGVHKDDLIVRLDPEATERALTRAHTRRFDLTGRPMKGWILVEPKGLRNDAALGAWIGMALEYVAKLPAASKSTKRTARAANDKGGRAKRR
ncbi:MAG TPA: TfoX/Sxy family protein [Gemmatimonadaceae bacterium]|nr:TfoX/Sxy family protein [Gemmatimonadaceae bacterium]